MNEQYVFVFANSLTSYCPLREELSISNWTKYLLATDNQLPYSVTCFASFPDIHAMGEGHGPDVWNHLQFILMGSHQRRFLRKTAFKSSQIPLRYRRTHHITQALFISSSPVHSRLKSLHCVQVDVPIVTPDCEHSSHYGGNPDSPTGGGQLGHVLPAVHSWVKSLYGAQGWIVIKTTFRTDRKDNY